MTQQGEIVKKPGKRMTTAGLVILALGIVLTVANLATTHVNYFGGRLVETQGTPSAGAIVLLVIGVLLVVVGFARRILAALERR